MIIYLLRTLRQQSTHMQNGSKDNVCLWVLLLTLLPTLCQLFSMLSALLIFFAIVFVLAICQTLCVMTSSVRDG